MSVTLVCGAEENAIYHNLMNTQAICNLIGTNTETEQNLLNTGVTGAEILPFPITYLVYRGLVTVNPR